MKGAVGLTVAIALIFLCGGAALYIVAQRMEPPASKIEIVIPDETFPR
jgi:hypothetical protein